MMSKRAKNAARILQVQVQLKRDAELRLMRASAETRRLDAEEIEMVSAMGRDDAAGLTLAQTGGPRLRSLLREQQRAAQETARCEARFKAISTQTVCVERLYQAVTRADRADAEKKILEEMVEQEWARATSLP
ncbi:MAG: hypothetical protein JWL62_188 [Hyphomicrobiales bacterium]|nr:hypothetical protein [Hyphomicrobiales bacterium]